MKDDLFLLLNNKTVSRLKGASSTLRTCVGPSTMSYYLVSFTEGAISSSSSCRANQQSGKSIVSPTYAERTVLNGNGRMSGTDIVKLHVALRITAEAQSFTFLCTWKEVAENSMRTLRITFEVCQSHFFRL